MKLATILSISALVCLSPYAAAADKDNGSQLLRGGELEDDGHHEGSRQLDTWGYGNCENCRIRTSGNWEGCVTHGNSNQLLGTADCVSLSSNPMSCKYRMQEQNGGWKKRGDRWCVEVDLDDSLVKTWNRENSDTFGGSDMTAHFTGGEYFYYHDQGNDLWRTSTDRSMQRLRKWGGGGNPGGGQCEKGVKCADRGFGSGVCTPWGEMRSKNQENDHGLIYKFYNCGS